MNAASPSSRPLQIVAVALAIVNVVLATLWLQRDTAPPPIVESSAPSASPAPSASGATATPAVEKPSTENSGIAAAAAPRDATTNEATTATVYGTVRRRDGSKPGQGWVSIVGNGNGETTDEGAFVIAGVAPGSHELSARFTDELPFKATVAVKAPSTRFDVVLDHAWLLTVNAVTPDGAPLMETVREQNPQLPWFRGLSVAAFDAPVTTLPLTDYGSLTAGIGAFRDADGWRGEKALAKETIGILTLPPDRAVHVALLLRGAVVAQMPASPQQNEVTFTLTPEALLAVTATVKLRIVDAQGTPVVGARVALNDRQSMGGGMPTDAEGRVQLRHVQPGRMTLNVMSPKGYAPPLVCDAPAGTNLDLGDVVLRELRKVDILVEPVTGKLDVRGMWLEPPPNPAWQRKSSYAGGGEGNQQTLWLHPGRNALLATCDSGCAIVEIDTAALPPQPVHITLQPGGELRVQNRVGPRFTRASVRAPNGVVVFSTEATGTWGRTVRVPIGTYEAVLEGMNGTTTQQLNVGSDGATLVIE